MNQRKTKPSLLRWTLLVLLAAPLLHLFLDCVPHWDASNLGTDYLIVGTSAWWEAALENVAGFVGIFLILRKLRLQWHFWVWAFLLSTWVPDLLTSLILSGRLVSPNLVWFQELHTVTHFWRSWYGEVPTFWTGLLGNAVNFGSLAIAWFYLYGEYQHHLWELSSARRRYQTQFEFTPAAD